MNKHTPGPWMLRTAASIASDCQMYRIIKDEEGKTVIVSDLSDTLLGLPTPADYLLITAAPDLLEALENLANVAERNTDDVDEWESVIAAARAAIAKAKGETKCTS